MPQHQDATISQETRQYYETVMNYVKEGVLPMFSEKGDLIAKIASLNEVEKYCLKTRIQSLVTRMPTDSVYSTPLNLQQERTSTIPKWGAGTAAVIAISAISYQISGSFYSSAAYTLLISSLIFFAKKTTQQNEVDKMFDRRMERADPFLDQLGKPDIRDITNRGKFTLKPLSASG